MVIAGEHVTLAVRRSVRHTLQHTDRDTLAMRIDRTCEEVANETSLLVRW